MAGAVGSGLSLAVFPRVEEVPARGIAVSRPGEVDALPDGRGLTVVVNPGSGSGSATELVDRIGEELPSAKIVTLEDDGDLVELLRSSAADSRSLGIVGGDGSVNVAARIALDEGVPLAVFPGGTLNHFARDLGLDSESATVEAIRDGCVSAIDVATIADRPFVNNASIGSYSALVDERERMEQRLGKWPAMVVALIRVLHRGDRFSVTLDGEQHTVWMVFFGNGEYVPAGFAPSSRPDLVDGLLDVRIVHADHPFSRARLVAALLLGALARSKVYERRCVPSMSVRIGDGESTTRLAADGETFDGPGAFVVAKRPAALLVHTLDHDDLA